MSTRKHKQTDTATPFFPIVEEQTKAGKAEHDRLQAWLQANKGASDFVETVFNGVKAVALKRQNLQPLAVVNS